MLHNNIIPIKSELDKIRSYAEDCDEANCEENDYTVYSYEELEYEYGLAKENVAKKLSFLENQVWVYESIRIQTLMQPRL